jgi:hypothetical protein
MLPVDGPPQAVFPTPPGDARPRGGCLRPAGAYAGEMPRSARLKPRELVPAWPDGPAADPIGEVALLFAGNLRRSIGQRSIRSVAEACGMNHATLIGILEGKAWPDMETIAKLERGLGTALWPGPAR